MRKITIALLLVAIGAVKGGGQPTFTSVGSVILYDTSNSRPVGALNFAQEEAPVRQMTVYSNMWGIPDGKYTAVVHNCQLVEYEDYCDHMESARRELNIEDPMGGERPMQLVRYNLDGPFFRRSTNIIKNASVIPGANDTILQTFIVIYRDSEAGLKLCGEYQRENAVRIAAGTVESNLIEYGEPKIPDPIYN